MSNDDISDSNGIEVESIGVALCQKLSSADANWKQTSYNSNMRGNYAGIGYTYMSNVATLGVGSTDIFISQQPYASWTISTTAAEWEPPSTPGAAPTLTDDEVAAGKRYLWNESNYQSDPATAWVLNETTKSWESPIGPHPETTDDMKSNGTGYVWDEDAHQADNTTGWVVVEVTQS